MESIIDTGKVVTELRERLSMLEHKVQALEKENACLRFTLHQTKQENERLRERLSQYEKPRKDSHNSSIPPGREDLSSQHIRRTQSLREKPDKPSGGQKGHPGQSFEFNKPVDCIEDHTVCYCLACGSELDGQETVLLEERWCLDIPPVVPRLTQHRILGKQCTCGCFNKGQAPSYLRGHFSYGPNLKAMIGYFNTGQHIPYKRLCELFQDVFNLTLSEGTIYNLLKNLPDNAGSLYREIRRRIEISPTGGNPSWRNLKNCCFAPLNISNRRCKTCRRH